MKKLCYLFLKAKTTHLVHLMLIFNVVNSQTNVLNMSSSDSTLYKKMQNSKHKAISHFNDSKYGMFIHWGLYAGDHVMLARCDISIEFPVSVITFLPCRV